MTIKEIANLAGVSISTVSKIVNNKDQNINPETRNRVLQIVKEYHYAPYSTARSISQAKTFLLGVLLRDASRSFQLIAGILQTAQEHGYNIMLFDSQNNSDTELKHITAMCENKVDGVIWEPVETKSLEYKRYLSEQDIFTIYVNAPKNISSYQIDFLQMGYHLTKQLLDYKHNKVGCFLKEKNVRSELILEGYKRCLYDNNITFDSKMVLYDSIENPMSKIMHYHITGIISSHYTLSLILYDQAKKFHYNIPYDLSLVSLKDNTEVNCYFPVISSIGIPYKEFGSYVCNQCINQCEKKETGQEPFLFSGSNIFDKADSIGMPAFLRAKKIVSVGSINIDSTFNVDLLPQVGKTTRIHNASTTMGGKGANQAVGVAKLGREVSLIGEIGNDVDSNFILDILDHEGIATQGIHRNLYMPTGKAYIYIEKSGESAITIMQGANSSLSADRIIQCCHLFKNAGYCLLSTEVSLSAVLTAAKIGKDSGAHIVLKPAAQINIPDELLVLTDIFVPNRKEAAILCPSFSTVEEQADYFFNRGIPIVIITLGKDGCYLKTADMAKYFPAADFVSIDTTGGADAFISALVSYLTENYPLERAIRIAIYAAGFCISKQGVVPALVDRSTLESHIGKLEPELLLKEI